MWHRSDAEDAPGTWAALADDFHARLPLHGVLWPHSRAPANTANGAGTASGTLAPPSSYGSAIGTTLGSSGSAGSAGSAAPASSPRQIPALHIDTCPFAPDLFPKYAPGGLHQNSLFMHIFFVGSDVVETYKASTRRAIQDWLGVVVNRKAQEWLIVQVVRGGTAASTASTASGTTGTTGSSLAATLASATAGSSAAARAAAGLFNIGGGSTVLDRIRNDFTLKRDRCVHLRLTGGDMRDAEAWSDLFDRIRDAVVSAILQQTVQFETDTRKLEQQRLMPGWNYCQYFVLKEALASTYELLTFFDDALLHYDELEATFHQTLAEQGAPWFQRFGGTEPGDDASEPLATDKKLYRNLIIQNAISIFDFREYLFGRQIRLLFLLGSPIDVCQRTILFVSSFSRTLKEYRVSLIPNFCEAWAYSLCSYIVRECDDVCKTMPLAAPPSALYDSLRAELIWGARIQLDLMGAVRGLHTLPPHFSALSLSTATSPSTPGASASTTAAADGSGGSNGADLSVSGGETTTRAQAISHPDLVTALSSKEAFDALYTRVTETAVRGFQSGNRHRVAYALQSDLAHLYFTRDNYERAAEIWDSITFKFSESGWHVIETAIVSRLAVCHRELRRYTRLVDCCLYLATHPQLLSPSDAMTFVDELGSSALLMPDPIVRTDSALFNVSVTSIICGVGDNDNIVATILIHSVLIKDFAVGLVSLTLTAGDGKDLVCDLHEAVLSPGKNTVRLTCPKSSVPGNYSPSFLVMQCGKLHFRYDIRASDRKKTLKLSETSSSLKMTAMLPGRAIGGEPEPVIAFDVAANRNVVVDGRLAVSALTSISFAWPKTVRVHVSSTIGKSNDTNNTVVASRDIQCDVVEGKLALPNLIEGERASFELPYAHTQDSRAAEHKLKMHLTCSTSDGEKRLYSSIVRLALVLPFSIDQHAYGNRHGTIVQSQICSHGAIPLRIVSASFASKSGHHIVPLVPMDGIVMFPNVSVSALFQSEIQSTDPGNDASNSTTDTLSLTLQYVLLSDDIEAFFLSRIGALMAQRDLSRYTEFMSGFIRKTVMPLIDPTEYAAFRKLELPKIDREVLESQLTPAENTTIRDALTSLLETLWDDVSRTLDYDTIHREVESRSLVHPQTYVYTFKYTQPRLVLELCLRPDDTEAVVGDPITCTLFINPVVWNLPKPETDPTCIKIETQIDLDFTTFAIAGKRRLVFDLRPSEIREFRVMLCPLHVGHLVLPSVSARVLVPVSTGAGGGNAFVEMVDVAVSNLGAGAQIAVLPRRQSAKIYMADHVVGVV